MSFAGFRFPTGKKDFSETVFGDGNARFYDATFGEGDVSFYGATFGEGDVSFSAAKFGDGNVNFYRATFGKGNVRFSDTAFGNGWVSFHGATFGDGEVDFHGAAFGEGNVSFFGATFGDGDVSFDYATFGEGDVSFEGATFGVGAVSFIDAIFDAGSISFRGTIFGKGVITFADAISGKGSLIFDDASFKENSIVFRNADINGHLRLQNCRNTKTLRILSFRALRLTGTFILEGNFTCVPDLRSTVMAAHVDLETSFIYPPRYKRRFPAFAFPRPATRHTAQLRRLKELAEQNCHHEAALRFFALERRDMRWTTSLSAWASGLDWFYDMACVYGQSVMRPAAVLVGLFAVFAGVYGLLDPCLGAWGALVKSAYYTVPFVFNKSARPATTVFRDPVHALTMAQQGFSFIFLFLLGVSLRNRFRLWGRACPPPFPPPRKRGGVPSHGKTPPADRHRGRNSGQVPGRFGKTPAPAGRPGGPR